jgi:endonuclease/exonuclease/phosphatase family metal-dependent hydrolase
MKIRIPIACCFVLLALVPLAGCQAVRTEMPDFLQKPSPDAVRVVSYNVNWDAIFPDDDPMNHEWREHNRAARFVRIVKAIQPDILCLQEINPERDPQDVGRILAEALPLSASQQWHLHKGADNVIASRYPLGMAATDTVPETNRGHAMALVDLPDGTHTVDLYLVNAHFKAAGGAENIARRQQHADAVVHWIGDARTPGGNIDLPDGTPFVILGDLNVYETDPHRHLTTLVTGDIADEGRYGADLAPDWDDTALTDALPKHNSVGPDIYTWRSDASDFKPGPLDRIIYSDSVLQVANSFVLNTTTLKPDELKATGLEAGDVLLDPANGYYDHLPLVVDFIVCPTEAAKKAATDADAKSP